MGQASRHPLHRLKLEKERNIEETVLINADIKELMAGPEDTRPFHEDRLTMHEGRCLVCWSSLGHAFMEE
jgi:hypothetical protein